MTDVREATDDLLAEKPQLESELRDVLAVDADADGWTFDEVPVDDLRIHERGLSADEVEGLYAGGSGDAGGNETAQ